MLIEIAPHEVERILRSRKAILIDVREREEYEQEAILGAILQPMSLFLPDGWLPVAGHRLSVLMCLGGIRSAAIGHRLLQAGHTPVTHMKGGLLAWKAAGLPTTATLLRKSK